MKRQLMQRLYIEIIQLYVNEMKVHIPTTASCNKSCINSEDTHNVISKILHLKEVLRRSLYWKACRCYLMQYMQIINPEPLNTLFEDGFTCCSMSMKCDKRLPYQLVCLGIGSLKNCSNVEQLQASHNQVACASLIQETFCIPPQNVIFYDPQMYQADYEILRDLGLLTKSLKTFKKTIDGNSSFTECWYAQEILEKQARSADTKVASAKMDTFHSSNGVFSFKKLVSGIFVRRPTILFMPHCDAELYGEILLSCCDPLYNTMPPDIDSHVPDAIVAPIKVPNGSLCNFWKALSNLLIFGNSFSEYELRSFRFKPLGMPVIPGASTWLYDAYSADSIKLEKLAKLTSIFRSSHMIFLLFPYILEHPIKEKYEFENAFNDLSFMSFDTQKLPDTAHSFLLATAKWLL
ncbi:SRR1-like protein [Cardiosporidium cionae]|uniref:SRR1-like protein n=1 Tax=Cardiosporidium cionae TaxID=476202 RepID=A0ABQ7JFI1_9APIC|nr:SRR1-like protein [Cardiosporidium cionae]|eukprot:KAF8822771.1 SRR1-like protein [Cardiosporidium cionae]